MRLNQQDRREVWDEGIAAAAAHVVHGHRLKNPYIGTTRRAHYWREAAKRTIAALNRVMEQLP